MTVGSCSATACGRDAAHEGVWVFFDEHMDRLFNSCAAVSLEPGLDRAGFRDAIVPKLPQPTP